MYVLKEDVAGRMRELECHYSSICDSAARALIIPAGSPRLQHPQHSTNRFEAGSPDSRFTPSAEQQLWKSRAQASPWETEETPSTRASQTLSNTHYGSPHANLHQKLGERLHLEESSSRRERIERKNQHGRTDTCRREDPARNRLQDTTPSSPLPQGEYPIWLDVPARNGSWIDPPPEGSLDDRLDGSRSDVPSQTAGCVAQTHIHTHPHIGGRSGLEARLPEREQEHPFGLTPYLESSSPRAAGPESEWALPGVPPLAESEDTRLSDDRDEVKETCTLRPIARMRRFPRGTPPSPGGFTATGTTFHRQLSTPGSGLVQQSVPTLQPSAGPPPVESPTGWSVVSASEGKEGDVWERRRIVEGPPRLVKLRTQLSDEWIVMREYDTEKEVTLPKRIVRELQQERTVVLPHERRLRTEVQPGTRRLVTKEVDVEVPVVRNTVVERPLYTLDVERFTKQDVDFEDFESGNIK